MKRYLILYNAYKMLSSGWSGSFKEITADSVKDGIKKYLDYNVKLKDVVAKGLSGFEECDLEGMIEYANMFLSSDDTIKQILEVDNAIWELAGADKR